jgi:hypothetical protein
MSRSAPENSITAATVKAAVKRAKLGAEEDIPDPACPGLMLRLRGGKANWSYRGRIRKTQKRWNLGGADVIPTTARSRCNAVKAALCEGIDPSQMVTALVTGIPISSQQRTRDDASVPWEKALDMFMKDVDETKSHDTFVDYRKKLRNELELKRFAGRSVSMITAVHIEEVLAEVAKRSQSAAEGLQRTLSSMWTYLARPLIREKTGVVPHVIREARPPNRRRERLEDPGYMPKDDEPPPDRIQIGRVVAIAKLGVFPASQSNAVLLLVGTAQRRRMVVGIRCGDLQSFDDEVLWKIPPYFRKPSKKKRSWRRHLVPAIGFAAKAASAMWQKAGEGNAWLLPAIKVRKKGVAAKTPYLTPRTLSRVFELMPGVSLSCHDVRYAMASYGPPDLGWQKDDAAIILDHLEGFDPGDVTAQFYDMDPAMVKKRKMMNEWIGWLEKQESAAIAADPMLKDHSVIAKLVAEKRRARTNKKRGPKMAEAA